MPIKYYWTRYCLATPDPHRVINIPHSPFSQKYLRIQKKIRNPLIAIPDITNASDSQPQLSTFTGCQISAWSPLAKNWLGFEMQSAKSVANLAVGTQGKRFQSRISHNVQGIPQSIIPAEIKLISQSKMRWKSQCLWTTRASNKNAQLIELLIIIQNLHNHTTPTHLS